MFFCAEHRQIGITYEMSTAQTGTLPTVPGNGEMACDVQTTTFAQPVTRGFAFNLVQLGTALQTFMTMVA